MEDIVMTIRTPDEEFYNVKREHLGGFRGFGGAVYVFRLNDGAIIESHDTWSCNFSVEMAELVGDEAPMTKIEGLVGGRRLSKPWNLKLVHNQVDAPRGCELCIPHRRYGDTNYVKIAARKEKWETEHPLRVCVCECCCKSRFLARRDEHLCPACEGGMEDSATGMYTHEELEAQATKDRARQEAEVVAFLKERGEC